MITTFRYRKFCVTLLTFLCLVLSVSSYAQITTATILGTVSDKTGGVIPNASVTATNVATGFSHTVNTNDQGDYRLEFLPIGDYTVRTEGRFRQWCR